MKILKVSEIRNLDKYTIENEPIPSIDLMERASQAVSEWFEANYDKDQIVRVLCGPGNNGGDGLAVARLLSQKGYKVEVDLVNPGDSFSPDAEINLNRLPANIPKRKISEVKDIPLNYSSEVFVDALFGSGLNRPLEGIFSDLVKVVNGWDADIVSIDIPSGVYCDEINPDPVKIHAKYTLSFQLPKLAFLLKENQEFIGEWTILDIGLSQEGLEKAESDTYFTTESEVRKILKGRNKFDHKGIFGHALIMAGSKGKVGAAVLASKAALRSGAGLVSSYVPECAYEIMQNSVPEAMCITDIGENYLVDIPDISSFDAIGIGPGMGTQDESLISIESLFERWEKALVIDADALNILAKHEHLLKLLPENCILTPHPGEFKRLAGEWDDEPEKFTLQRAFSKNYKCIIVLKGAYTSISDSDGNIFFNSTGNPGMATGGSGDVLTGMITAMLAKGLKPLDAAKSAVYLHGLAGDLALNWIHEESMTAGDIINNISGAFSSLY